MTTVLVLAADPTNDIREKQMNEMWNTLYHEALKVLKPRKVSKMLETAGVAAAVESISGKIYVGVCVDGACRELMTQLMPDNYRKIEVMMDYEKGEVVTLGELTPRWWI